ncbi:RNA polymerase sigma factor [Polyangium sp. 6x1]|uniref:RNA polymerase sigma factor n=1 Tax=Polyangium sp. 6x1 TaxID=3042689 RepID=UPI002482B6F9|nr:RNA polymerase sigma factor [Polyangium sp. 6x1]MDI1443309.1 RNA polymerase sigma factor [Polyangium sp. 6x1]
MDPALAPLVARLRDRDPSAFDEVYARYHERVFRFLLRLSGKRQVAEDLFQETWLAVARDATSLADDSDLAAWIFTLARNRYRSHRRWAMLDLTRVFSFGAEQDVESPSPEGEVAARAEASAAREAFASLAPAAKEVLLLAVGEGLEAPRVAEVLGISPEAARQRLSRARAELATAIEKGNNRAVRKGSLRP